MRGLNKIEEIPDLLYENTVAKTDEEKATLFGRRLKEIFSNNVKSTNSKLETEINTLMTILNKKKASATFNHFTIEELQHEIKHLNDKTSTDEDNLSNKILKKIPKEFMAQILALFNKIVQKNEIPIQWKCSIVKMIAKKGGEKENPSSYRPISITSCLMRLMEKLVLKRLNTFLKENKIVIHEQSGFRTGRQTRDNLFNLVQKTTEGFNRGQKTICILFDLEKAFDKMWHDALIYKLHKLNVPEYIVLFIKEFLSNRTFKVRINSFTTMSITINCGCPQGACLSPELFTVFINDIPIMSFWHTKTSLFADDIMFMSSYKNSLSNKQKNGNDFSTS